MIPPPPPPAVVVYVPPPPVTVAPRRVKRYVVKLVRYDRNMCVVWKSVKPRKRFVERMARQLATNVGWRPHRTVKKGIRLGFRKACQ